MREPIRNLSVSLGLAALLVLPASISAEITSNPCPYSCKTRGLSHDSCKDWREGDKCFVDDLQQAKAKDSADLDRKIVMVNKTILAGKKIEVQLPNNSPIDHLDAVVRRSGGSSDTQLFASLGDGIEFGAKQVDHNENQVIQFSAEGARAEGRRLVLTATSGDIFVESVHVMTR